MSARSGSSSSTTTPSCARACARCSQLHADIEVVGEGGERAGGDRGGARLDPDVVLMDIAMPGLGGIEATLELKKLGRRAKVLILSQYEDREYVRRLLKAGVSGYVLKKSAGAELANAIRAVHRGGLVLDPEVARTAMAEANPAAPGARRTPTRRSPTARSRC